MYSGKGFFLSFPNTFLWLLPNIEQKRNPLNDNIVAHTPESSKICQKVEAFHIKCTEILRNETF